MCWFQLWCCSCAEVVKCISAIWTAPVSLSSEQDDAGQIPLPPSRTPLWGFGFSNNPDSRTTLVKSVSKPHVCIRSACIALMFPWLTYYCFSLHAPSSPSLIFVCCTTQRKQKIHLESRFVFTLTHVRWKQPQLGINCMMQCWGRKAIRYKAVMYYFTYNTIQ